MTTKFSLPLEIKASDVASSGEFAGYAAAFGNVDLGGDVILPGAFAKTLAEHKARASQPALLWSHDQSMPIGTITTLNEDRKGLRMQGRLTLAVRAAAEAYALLKDGAVGGMSIGYSIPSGGAENGGDARLLKEIDLYEISLVAVPMNPAAQVTAVKAMDCANPRELERLLRDHLSLSKRKAVAASSALWPVLNGRDDQEDDRDDRAGYSPEGLKTIVRELESINLFLKGQR